MLTTQSALRKDKGKIADMEHRHFATIATIIHDMRSNGVLSTPDAQSVAEHFADKLAATNLRFDRGRFLRAC